jgi:hypothetical protein
MLSLSSSINKPILEDKKPELKEGEYAIRKRKPKKVLALNPRTNRMKKFKRTQWIVTKVAPKDRTVRNVPKDAKGFPVCTHQTWLEIEGERQSPSSSVDSFGKSRANGKWYGWSHRAIASFGIGDVVKPTTSGFDHLKEPFIIKTEEKAKEVAKRFARSVS